MISKIQFSAGATPQSQPLELEPTPITVFVGPNNSGKSRVLIELENWTKNGNDSTSLLIHNVSFSALSSEDVRKEIERLRTIDVRDTEREVIIRDAFTGIHTQININDAIATAQQPDLYNGTTSFSLLRRHFVLRLDGQQRLTLINEVEAGDLQEASPRTLLAKLFKSDILRAKVRLIIDNAINKFFVIDPTNLGKLRVRFSSRAPISENEERGLTSESIAFHNAAETIAQVSDGIKAFSGVIATLIAGNPRLMLIDEPEAFLHPALAMKLGKEMGLAMNNPNKRLFVATHSAAFIMGCIQSRAFINIVRLTYKNGIGTARLLDRDKLLHLMRNPMLRSTGVLEGLFYESVIVTEADADRAFYQEINERLRSDNDPRGISNCLFINAQNKQTVWDIVKPLRELGIPAVGIVDIDMLKDVGADAARVMESTFIPELQRQAMAHLRTSLKKSLDEKAAKAGQLGNTDKNWWKINGGIELLDSTDKQAAISYFSQLDEYGVFVVRNGELEVWLKHLIPKVRKSRWLSEIFIAMGEDPATPEYIRPSAGDVWDFIGNIKKWFDNTNRLGIPD